MSLEEASIVPLKDVVKRVKVGFVGSCNDDYCSPEVGVPMIRTTNLTKEGIKLENLKYINNKFHVSHIKSQLNFGDILIARHGHNGLASLWEYKFDAQCLNVVVVEPNESLADKYYLTYLINSPLIQQQIKSLTGGSVQSVVNTKDIADLLIPVPPLSKQKEIANFILLFNKKIAINKSINKNLLSIVDAIYKKEFQNFDSYSEDELITSDFGLIPKNWCYKTLDEISDVAIGKTPPRKETWWFSEQEGVKWVSIKDLGNSGTYIFETSEYLTKEAIEKFNVKLIPKDTVILSFKLTVGRIGITTEEMVTNEAIAHFKLTENSVITKEYLYLYLKNFNYEELGSTSSIAKAINSKIVKKIPILIPNNKINEFKDLFENIFDKIKSNQLEINKLTKLRNTLLPKLMSGEIDVSKINCDLELKYNYMKYLFNQIHTPMSKSVV